MMLGFLKDNCDKDRGDVLGVGLEVYRWKGSIQVAGIGHWWPCRHSRSPWTGCRARA